MFTESSIGRTHSSFADAAGRIWTDTDSTLECCRSRFHQTRYRRLRGRADMQMYFIIRNGTTSKRIAFRQFLVDGWGRA
jgi:hypothetical protein